MCVYGCRVPKKDDLSYEIGTWYVVRGSVTSVCVYYVLVCVCTCVGTVVYDIYS